MMMALPVMRAGPTFPRPRRMGQFQGTIAPQTPSGGKVEYTIFSSVSSMTSSFTSIFAKVRSQVRVMLTSCWASVRGLPCSIVWSFSTSSRFASTASAKASMSLERSSNEVLLHDLKALRACWTASSSCSLVATGTSYRAFSVAGSIECRVVGVEANLPLMMFPGKDCEEVSQLTKPSKKSDQP